MEMEKKNCPLATKNVILVTRRRDLTLDGLRGPYNCSGEDSANDVISLELSDTEISSDDDDFSLSQDDPLDQFDSCNQSDFTLDSDRVLSDVLYRDWAKLRGVAAPGLISKQFPYSRNSQGAGHALEDRWLLPVLLRPTTPSSDRLFIKLIPRRLAGKHTLSCHRVDKTLLLPHLTRKKSDDEDHLSDFSIPRVPSRPDSETSSRTAGQKCTHAASERLSNKANSGSDISRKVHNNDLRAHIRRTAEHRNALAQEGMKIEERNRIRDRDARNRADHQENTQQSDQSMPTSSADGDSGSNDSDSRDNVLQKPDTPPGNDTSEGDNNADDDSALAVSVTDASARGKTFNNSIGATNSSLKESEDSSKLSANDLSMFRIQNAEYDFLNFYRSIYKYEVEPEIEALLQKKVLDCAKIAKAEENDFDKGNEGGDEEDEEHDEEDLDCKIDLVKGTWETLRMVHEVGQEGMFNEAYGSYDKVIKTFMDSASVYLGLNDPNLRGQPTETEDHLHSRFLTSEVALPSMGSDLIIGLRRSDAFTNQNTASSKPTTTEQTLTNHDISHGNSSNNTNKQSSGNSNENGSTGNCNSGNGNGNSSNGNGNSSNGNGHSSNGNGHSSNGNGNSSNGNGHSSNGRGNSSNGNENSSDRNGHSSNGKGLSSNGNEICNSSNGNGNGSNNDCNVGAGVSRIMYGENRSYVPPCRHAIEDRIGEISDNALFGSDSNCSIEIDDDPRNLRGIPGTFPQIWDTMDPNNLRGIPGAFPQMWDNMDL